MNLIDTKVYSLDEIEIAPNVQGFVKRFYQKPDETKDFWIKRAKQWVTFEEHRIAYFAEMSQKEYETTVFYLAASFWAMHYKRIEEQEKIQDALIAWDLEH